MTAVTLECDEKSVVDKSDRRRSIDAGREAWQALCYQQHRGPPLQKTQGWGTHVLIWETKEKTVDKAGPPAFKITDGHFKVSTGFRRVTE